MRQADQEFEEKVHVIVHHEHMNAFVFGLKLGLAYAWAVLPLCLVVLFVFIPFAWPLIPGLVAIAVAPAVKLVQDYTHQTKEEATPWE